MTVVVADTSPINYLVLIGEIGVLHQLYVRVIIPEDVLIELIDMGAPPEVREWATQRPAWIEIRQAPARDAALMDLDAGEASAIALAELETDALLLIDESAGRREASRRGIRNTGTLGVLRRAAIEHLVDLSSALNRLLATNFIAPSGDMRRWDGRWPFNGYRRPPRSTPRWSGKPAGTLLNERALPNRFTRTP